MKSSIKVVPSNLSTVMDSLLEELKCKNTVYDSINISLFIEKLKFNANIETVTDLDGLKSNSLVDLNYCRKQFNDLRNQSIINASREFNKVIASHNKEARLNQMFEKYNLASFLKENGTVRLKFKNDGCFGEFINYTNIIDDRYLAFISVNFSRFNELIIIDTSGKYNKDSLVVLMGNKDDNVSAAYNDCDMWLLETDDHRMNAPNGLFRNYILKVVDSVNEIKNRTNIGEVVFADQKNFFPYDYIIGDSAENILTINVSRYGNEIQSGNSVDFVSPLNDKFNFANGRDGKRRYRSLCKTVYDYFEKDMVIKQLKRYRSQVDLVPFELSSSLKVVDNDYMITSYSNPVGDVGNICSITKKIITSNVEEYHKVRFSNDISGVIFDDPRYITKHKNFPSYSPTDLSFASSVSDSAVDFYKYLCAVIGIFRNCHKFSDKYNYGEFKTFNHLFKDVNPYDMSAGVLDSFLELKCSKWASLEQYAINNHFFV